MTQEQPPPESSCVVDSCSSDATVFVDVAGGGELSGETAVPMCDEHAAHWRSGG